jgi:hypothetical protein
MSGRAISQQGLAASLHPVLGPDDLRAVGAPRRRGASSEAGIVVNGKCHTAVGVSETERMTAVIEALLSQRPHALAASQFADSVRHSPLRITSTLDPLHRPPDEKKANFSLDSRTPLAYFFLVLK